MTYLFVHYSVKYFHKGKKENVLLCTFPCPPMEMWRPEQREALEEETHVQGWGCCEFGGKGELPGAR